MARLINHVDLTVINLAHSRAFYEPVMRYLGYEMSTNTPQEVVFSHADRSSVTTIGLHPARSRDKGRKHDRNSPGLHHLAFDAESREDVDGLHALLLELRVDILDAPAVYYPPDYYAVFFADPDGLKLELAHTPGLRAELTKSISRGPAENSGAALRKIDCVMIKVDDLGDAAKFYERVLRLAPRWSSTHSVALGMPESEAEIVLHDDPQIPRECGVHYLVDNVKEAVAMLSVQGCEIAVPPFEVQIGMCSVVRDPFGNLLNLIDMSKGPIKAA